MSTVYTIDGNAFRIGTTSLVKSSWTETSTSTSTAVTGMLVSYSPVYGAPMATARCYEQIFAYTTDPKPQTEDWFNAVTSFEAITGSFEFDNSSYPYMSYKATASVLTTASLYDYEIPTPKFRGVMAWNNNYSATIPTDGFTSVSWTGGTQQMSATAEGPISALVGNNSGTYTAAVAVYNPIFGTNRTDWEEGRCLSLPNGCRLYGAYQFINREPRTATVTSTSTSTKTAWVTVTSYSPEVMAREEGV